MQKNRISKRAFLKGIFSLSGFIFCRQAKAFDFVVQMEEPMPNPFQSELIKEKKKQILIAETEECLGYWPPFKAKCNSGD